MSKFLLAGIAAIALVGGSAVAMGASAGNAVRGGTPLKQRAQYNDDGNRHACAYRYYYACRANDSYYGYRMHCACWPDWPYWQH